jgi:hypothetical protein
MEEMTTMASLREVFAFPLRGPDWRQRFIIGSAILIAGFFIPILPLIFVCGYVVALMRQAIQGDDLVLPRWGDWGKLASDGLRAMVAGFVYLLPGLLIAFVGFALYFAASFAMPFAIEAGDDILWPLLFFGGFAIMFLTMFLGTVVTVLGAIPLPIATAHLVAEDDLAAAFRLRQWWPLLRANPLGVFIAWVVVAGLMGIFYLVIMLLYYTLVLCCAAPLLAGPIGFYVLLVAAALFGRTYRESWRMVADQEVQPTP